MLFMLLYAGSPDRRKKNDQTPSKMQDANINKTVYVL